MVEGAHRERADARWLWDPTRRPPAAPGLSQTALGIAVGVTKRVIVYYEGDGAQLPGAMLVTFVEALLQNAGSRKRPDRGRLPLERHRCD